MRLPGSAWLHGGHGRPSQGRDALPAHLVTGGVVWEWGGNDTGNCRRGKRLERVTEFLVQLVKQSQTAELKEKLEQRQKGKKKLLRVFETVEWLRESLEVEPLVPVRARQEGDGGWQGRTEGTLGCRAESSHTDDELV